LGPQGDGGRGEAEAVSELWALKVVRTSKKASELVNTQVGVVVATIVLVVLGLLSYRKTISRYVEIA